MPTNSNEARRSSWLNRTVLGIGLASLFSDVGHEMATSAMPAWLTSIGASSAALGLIEGLATPFMPVSWIPIVEFGLFVFCLIAFPRGIFSFTKA